jgi:hypothetical protein
MPLDKISENRHVGQIIDPRSPLAGILSMIRKSVKRFSEKIKAVTRRSGT